MKTRPIIGITMGDPAGIGPEICLKALSRRGAINNCLPVLIGDPDFLKRTAKILSIPVVIRDVDRIDIYPQGGDIVVLSVTDIDLTKVIPGKIDGIAGMASFEYIKKAVSLAMEGKVHGLVTAPISKISLKMAGLPYSGHTEIISHITSSLDTVMMFVTKKLRASLVTRHLPLREAIDQLNPSRIEKVIEVTNDHLIKWFGIGRPKIGVAGINPHAGEGGLFGNDEAWILEAIEIARKKGIDAIGPLPADSIFYLALRGEFDCVIAMYHDQGLIPIKLLDFHGAVNITLGLPFVRTSVSHGTAYDIAGKGVADPSSLINAIRLTAKISSLKGS